MGILLVLAPVAWRNHRVSGEWILTTAGAGTNFCTGNNPGNPSGGYHSVPFVRPQSQHEEDDFRAEAEVRTGRRLGPTALSSYWFRESLRHMASWPAFALRVTLNKVVLFWSDVELADGWDMDFLARYSPVLGLPLLGFAGLLPLAIAGATALLPTSRPARLLVGYLVVYAASVIAFYVFSRYRLHVLPARAVLAAAGAGWMVERARMRRWRPLAASLALAVGVALFSLHGARTLVGLIPGGAVNSPVNLAGLVMERKEFGAAAGLLREALERHPGRPAVLCRIGELGLRTGQFADARDAYDRCLRADPRYPDAWYHLGIAQERLGDPRRAAAAHRQQLQAMRGHGLSAARLAALGPGR